MKGSESGRLLRHVDLPALYTVSPLTVGDHTEVLASGYRSGGKEDAPPFADGPDLELCRRHCLKTAAPTLGPNQPVLTSRSIPRSLRSNTASIETAAETLSAPVQEFFATDATGRRSSRGV